MGPFDPQNEAYTRDINGLHSVGSAPPHALCYYEGTRGRGDQEDLKWGCGIPKLGKAVEKQGKALQNNIPDGPDGYAPGRCTMHIVQYEKSDPAKDQYSLEALVKDANSLELGKISPRQVLEKPLEIASKLGKAVVFKARQVDSDPLDVEVGDDKWTTNDKRCSPGKFEDHMRQIDCGFAC